MAVMLCCLWVIQKHAEYEMSGNLTVTDFVFSRQLTKSPALCIPALGVTGRP